MEREAPLFFHDTCKKNPDTWILAQVRDILIRVIKSTNNIFLPHLEDLLWMLCRSGNTPTKIFIGIVINILTQTLILPCFLVTLMWDMSSNCCWDVLGTWLGTIATIMMILDIGPRSMIVLSKLIIRGKETRNPQRKSKQRWSILSSYTTSPFQKQRDLEMLCVDAFFRPIGGNGFHKALKHIKTSQHEENIERMSKLAQKLIFQGSSLCHLF